MVKTEQISTQYCRFIRKVIDVLIVGSFFITNAHVRKFSLAKSKTSIFKLVPIKHLTNKQATGRLGVESWELGTFKWSGETSYMLFLLLYSYSIFGDSICEEFVECCARSYHCTQQVGGFPLLEHDLNPELSLLLHLMLDVFFLIWYFLTAILYVICKRRTQHNHIKNGMNFYILSTCTYYCYLSLNIFGHDCLTDDWLWRMYLSI